MQANFGRGDRPGHDITPIPDVEGHGLKHGLSDDPEVEGQAFRWNGRDADGNEFEHPLRPNRQRLMARRRRRARGRGARDQDRGVDQEPDVEGHGVKFKYSDDQGQEHEVDAHAARVKFRDDDGQEQEVDGTCSTASPTCA